MVITESVSNNPNYRTDAGPMTEVRVARDTEYLADKRVPNHTSRTHRYLWNEEKLS